MFRLDGKTALVTGAGSGIGEAIALCFAGQGATVWIIDRDEAAAHATVAAIKATGGAGVIAYNTLGSSVWGLVLSDNSAFVTVEYNLVQGHFQHGIFLTTGTTAARARLLNDTVEQTGRLTSSGDASGDAASTPSRNAWRKRCCP